MEPEELAALEQELYHGLRNASEIRRLMLIYINERASAHKTALSVRLLSERDSDTLRGNIAELQKLEKLIKNGGTQ